MIDSSNETDSSPKWADLERMSRRVLDRVDWGEAELWPAMTSDDASEASLVPPPATGASGTRTIALRRIAV